MTEASITWLIALNFFYPSFYLDLPAPSTIGFRHLCFNKSRWWVVKHNIEREREAKIDDLTKKTDARTATRRSDGETYVHF